MITDLFKGLAALIRELLPAFLATLLGAARAERDKAQSDAETLAKQNEIASRPDVPDGELDDWLRQRR
ncbi:hypothetical protein [Inquilinus sp. OTU3971]|uniref:hypothetical protein n=1 Tax=Inquilinus sp. OTU3971 TaxID=3043855 RepID=UPI00313EE2AA